MIVAGRRTRFEPLLDPGPGVRGLVTFEDDPGWAHERLFLWPAAAAGGEPEGYFVYTPGGDMYVESLADYGSGVFPTGRRGYPRGVPQVVAFNRPLEPEEMVELIKRARAESVIRSGASEPDGDIAEAVDWQGRRLRLPAYSAVHAPRVPPRRLRGKQPVEGAEPLVPLADQPGGGTPTPPAEAADGVAWLSSDVAEASGEFAFGTEVLPGADFCRRGSCGVAVDASGRPHPVELVETSRAGEWREAKLRGADRLRPRDRLGLEQRLLGDGAGGAPQGGSPPPGPEAADATGDDLRTCWIDYDDAGVRYKEWKKVLYEATEESMASAGLRGPPVCLSVCRKFFKAGGSPKAWFPEWCREVGITRKDRAWHEVECLIEALWQAGTFDQLNMGAIAAMEVIARRLLQYVEAYAKGAENPNWSAAKHFSATTSALDLVPENMRMHAARQAKEETELESLRARARQPGAAAHAGADPAAAATLAGGLPSQAEGDQAGGRGGGRQGGRGGRGRGPRPAT